MIPVRCVSLARAVNELYVSARLEEPQTCGVRHWSVQSTFVDPFGDCSRREVSSKRVPKHSNADSL